MTVFRRSEPAALRRWLAPVALCLVVGLAAGPLMACSPAGSSPATMSAAQTQAIIDTITREVKAAYDITKPDAEQRLLSLYADTGRVVSAGAGRMITSRDTLAMGIRAFWTNVGANMRDPKWIWDNMVFDVLSPTAAVMTATYHVPHRTPRNQPHTIAGAWTAVFQKRGGRWVIIQEHLSDVPAMPDSAMAPMPPGMKMPK